MGELLTTNAESSDLRKRFLQIEDKIGGNLLVNLTIAISQTMIGSPETVKKQMEIAGINLTPKDMKKYPWGAISRIVKKYSSVVVQQKIAWLNTKSVNLEKYKKLSLDEQKTVIISTNYMSFELYYIVKSLENPDLQRWFLEEFLPKNTEEELEFYRFVSSIGEYYLQSLTQSIGVQLVETKRINRQLETNLILLKRDAQQAKTVAYQKAQEVKELKREIVKHQQSMDQIINCAIEEVDSHIHKDLEYKKQLEFNNKQCYEQIEKLQQIIIAKDIEIQNYKKENANLTNIAAPLLSKLPLKGKTICVVGGDQMETEYRRILNSYGAEMIFISGFANSNMVDKFINSDMVIQITVRMKHKIAFQITSALKNKAIPVIRLNQTSVTGFENCIKNKVIAEFAKCNWHSQ